MIRLFTSEGCPNCPAAKDMADTLIKEGFKVKKVNISQVDGFAEAAFYDVMGVPTWVFTNENDKVVYKYSGANVPKDKLPSS